MIRPWKRYTVGIEMEFNTVTRQRQAIGGMQINRALSDVCTEPVTGDGSQYRYSSGTAWDVKYDGTAGWEVASPALRFDDDAECLELKRACGALKTLNPAIDTTCGLHVSIFCRDFSWQDLQRLHAMWVRYESFFFDMLPDSRAKAPNHGTWYCRPLRESGIYESKSQHWDRAQEALRATTDRDFKSAIEQIGKYASLNMATWWMHGRVEFRLHSGTIDYEKIRNWTILLCSFVERAIGQRTFGQPAIKVEIPKPASVENRKGWNSDYILTLLGLSGADAHPVGATLREYADERRKQFGLKRRREAKRDGTFARLLAPEQAEQARAEARRVAGTSRAFSTRAYSYNPSRSR